MSEHIASCRCGQLRIHCIGEPVRVSVCHCLECQKRTGSAFGAQVRWEDDQVMIEGIWSEWSRTADSGNRATYRFCAKCGSTVAYSGEGMPGYTAVPVGAFAGQDLPSPIYSFYERRQVPWTAVLGDEVEHIL